MTPGEPLKIIGFHALVFIAAFAVFVLLFSTSLFAAVLLFYRGLLFVALVTPILVLSLILVKKYVSDFLTYRDVVIAALLFSFTATAVFIILPVTLDRSISIFMLGYMARHPEKYFTTAEMDKIFVDDYVHKYESVQRRFDEQVISKNIVQTGDGYALTSRGVQLMELFKFVAKVFAVNPRFVDPE